MIVRELRAEAVLRSGGVHYGGGGDAAASEAICLHPQPQPAGGKAAGSKAEDTAPDAPARLAHVAALQTALSPPPKQQQRPADLAGGPPAAACEGSIDGSADADVVMLPAAARTPLRLLVSLDFQDAQLERAFAYDFGRAQEKVRSGGTCTLAALQARRFGRRRTRQRLAGGIHRAWLTTMLSPDAKPALIPSVAAAGCPDGTPSAHAAGQRF